MSEVSEKLRQTSSLIKCWEAFCIAVDSIWVHKLRSALTLLGVIIGVASVLIVAGVIGGLDSFVSNRLVSTFGSNTFIVGQFVRLNMTYDEWLLAVKRNKRIYNEDIRIVEEKCDGCSAVSPRLSRRDDAKREDKIYYEASVHGVNPDILKIQDIKLSEGRFISDLDVEHARQLAVIGFDVREELFGPTDAIGKEFKLGGENYTVIGMEERNGSIMGQSLDNKIYIPFTTFLKKYGSRQSIDFQVKAPSAATLVSTQDEIRQIMRVRHKLRPNQDDDFDILSMDAIQNMIGQFTGIVGLVAMVITGISLLVGAIVIMNIMLVTVTERTPEIGMRKAVGAKRMDILLQFLIESSLLGSIGGAFGVLIAYILSLIIRNTTPLPMHISMIYIVITLLISGGIGMISGIYPAYKASKLDPIVALARE